MHMKSRKRSPGVTFQMGNKGVCRRKCQGRYQESEKGSIGNETGKEALLKKKKGFVNRLSENPRNEESKKRKDGKGS